MKNPFIISFGQEPEISIDRSIELNEIEKTFLSERPTTQVYMITGVRGSGKTVALNKIANKFNEYKDWIVIDLNPTEDILEGLAAKLYDQPLLKKLFINAEINLSAFGIGLSIKNVPPIAHIETAIEKMLNEIKKQNKKVLICIDEAVNNSYMKVFTSSFQLFIRHNLPLYLIMAGLYQNIDALQNEETLTFLYRAPKITLTRLSISAIATTYKDNLDIDENESIKLAKLTNGYPFAYQVLGYLCFDRQTTDLKKILPSYDQYLEEYVYQKIWAGLTEKEKMIVEAIIKGNNKTQDIRKYVGMQPGAFSVYRNRLNKKGIVDVSTYGRVEFTLPRFSNILANYID